jgi:glycine hydroxymethyltransferase
VPHCDFVTSTTHKTLRGPRGGLVLCKEQFAKNLDREVMPGMQGGPLMHVIAAKAIAFKEALSDEFRTYQQRVIDNASVLGQALTKRNFRIVSGGTDNHLLLVDLTAKNITGRKAEVVLGKAGIIVNRNLIPYDKEKPLVTSGVRLGSPATTTRGMGTEEMKTIAGFIERVIENADDDAALETLHAEVKEFCRKFPMYPHLLEQYGVAQ